MESLESKLDRLSPEQRREAEDFVDFLLSRSGQVPALPGLSGSPPPPVSAAPPPLSLSDPAVHGIPAHPAGHQDPMPADNTAAPVFSDEPAPASFHEIGGGSHDHMTSDYMDYGQFERQPSPADEAVKKIKRKIIAREGQDKPRHLLDWVD
ncbi:MULTISPECIES: hypothetical protein [unclassified Methanoregula]|uniref:hypothetical protein n=1 Tax=unclassified Methanoregula TaxID=2649730 RepID=UPI0009C5253F|nr:MULTISPECIES: hypothetical protein [unclassified Methanoregula]OPX64171.1 MAG: hypothetical protein A4E33_01198 [Methanoregula sp. PtaB.Bin085]OPY34709.1 MAG: hypothetical protein A4E34_01235 [Methanoregula sp. PtaU1.Bin006]